MLGFSQDVIFQGDIDKALDTLSVQKGIYFDKGKWDLKPESKPALDSLVALLKERQEIKFQVTVYTKERYPDNSPYSLSLSQKRAQTICDYLIEQNVDDTNLTARGVTLTEDKYSDMSERIEIIVLERKK